MSAASRWAIFLLLLAGYGALFAQQEHRFAGADQQLAFPLPPTVQRAALGYLRQLGGEMEFIRAGVFYGGVKPGRDPLSYAEPLAQHFAAAAALHPAFIDTYFLCQAALPPINAEYARYADSVLAKGIAALPDNIVLPFFAGFNSFYYLNEPLEAARLFRLAATRPNAPPMLEHLANILSAEGGDIYAALIGLRGLYVTERDEQVRQRYAEEMAAFQQALMVLNAVKKYEQTTGAPPSHLEDLVPHYLPTIPDVGPIFRLEWKPPHLSVVRLAKRVAKPAAPKP